MILVVGLGNPGDKYASTRHNVGFRVVDRLVEQARGGPWRDKFSGRLASFELEGEAGLALEPMTYMNESGRSVQPAAAFYKIDPSELLVVHDELDLPFGRLQLKKGGGDAGHKGLKSVTQHLGSGEYVRLRVGIGRPPPDFRGDGADFVLQAFAPNDRAGLDEVLERAVRAITLFASRGLSDAMNAVNQKPKPKTDSSGP